MCSVERVNSRLALPQWSRIYANFTVKHLWRLALSPAVTKRVIDRPVKHEYVKSLTIADVESKCECSGQQIKTESV